MILLVTMKSPMKMALTTKRPAEYVHILGQSSKFPSQHNLRVLLLHIIVDFAIRYPVDATHIRTELMPQTLSIAQSLGSSVFIHPGCFSRPPLLLPCSSHRFRSVSLSLPLPRSNLTHCKAILLEYEVSLDGS